MNEDRFEAAVSKQCNDYKVQFAPNGDWLFQCDEWLNISEILRQDKSLISKALKPHTITDEAWNAAVEVLPSSTATEVPIVVEWVAQAIQAAANAEREACAKLADELSNPYKGGQRGVAQEQGMAIAAAIRKRGAA